MIMNNIIWLIFVCIILGIIGWGSLLLSCCRENKKNYEPLSDV